MIGILVAQAFHEKYYVSYPLGCPSMEQGDFTYIPNLVKFHIDPKEKGVSIAAWASDCLPPTSGETDANGDLTLKLLPSVEYNLLIIREDNRSMFIKIYPSESYYVIHMRQP